MCGSILWHSDKLNEARRTHREWFYIEIGGNVGGLLDHKGYDKWLQISMTDLVDAAHEADMKYRAENAAAPAQDVSKLLHFPLVGRQTS